MIELRGGEQGVILRREVISGCKLASQADSAGQSDRIKGHLHLRLESSNRNSLLSESSISKAQVRSTRQTTHKVIMREHVFY